ncbi:MAG TPA: TonB-dependent receptor, partial [Gemmatimonadales bacterium]|nr:TonB-dependent receptor [Gemmatimonadales bacterium]
EIPVGLHTRWRATGGVYANPPADVWKFRDHTGGLGGGDVTTSYGTDEVRGALTLGARHSDGYREQDQSDQWETSGRAEWHPAPGTQVTAAGAWTSHQYDVFPTWCVPGACDTRGQAFQPFRIDTSSRGSYTRSDKGFVFATLERTVSPRLNWLARGSWVRTHFTDVTPTDWGVSNRLGTELRGTLVAPERARVVTAGAEGTRSDVTSDIFRTHTEVSGAAYAEVEQGVGSARVTAGARVDAGAVDGAARAAVVSPRVGAVFPTSWGAWRASIARGFRAPTLAERFVTTRAFGFQVIPNPALDPETAWSVELGDAAALRAWGRLDAAVFWTEARQLIEPVLRSQDTIDFENVARARLRGLDASLTATPFTPALTVSGAYLFLDARDLKTDSALAFRPKHLVTVSADYRWRSFSGGADFRYSSRIERIELEAVYGRDPRIAAKVLDLRAGWQRGPFAARLLVANALNYIYNLIPRTLEPVRTLSVVLTWSD